METHSTNARDLPTCGRASRAADMAIHTPWDAAVVSLPTLIADTSSWQSVNRSCAIGCRNATMLARAVHHRVTENIVLALSAHVVGITQACSISSHNSKAAALSVTVTAHNYEATQSSCQPDESSHACTAGCASNSRVNDTVAELRPNGSHLEATKRVQERGNVPPAAMLRAGDDTDF